ncbi:hypothetical protein KAJ61_00870 [Candidatus Parcubacteria bacterium]|nr:hypothetical protein [Candidatus Parcubacteria bacterium]
MSITTAICWLIWTYVLWMINPVLTNWIGFVLFYSSLFLALIGTGAIFGFAVRFIALKKELAFRLVKESFRQSFLFALLIIISLILLSYNLFTWLNLILLIFGLSVLEFFMLSFTTSKKRPVGTDVEEKLV